MFFTPNPAKRTKRLLETAQNELLDAEAQLENARAVRDAIAKRVARLQIACQPAPTKQPDAVAKGDITPLPGSVPRIEVDTSVQGQLTDLALRRTYRQNGQ